MLNIVTDFKFFISNPLTLLPHSLLISTFSLPSHSQALTLFSTILLTEKSNYAPLLEIAHFWLCFLVPHDWTLLLPATWKHLKHSQACFFFLVLTPVSFFHYLVSSLPPEIPIPSYSPLISPHQLFNFCFSLLFKHGETCIYLVLPSLCSFSNHSFYSKSSSRHHSLPHSLLLSRLRELLNLGSFAVIQTFLSFLNHF